MTATIRRLMLITDVRRSRLALAALLGVLTILFGVGLMGTAGYLISRAAEHPAVLSLTAAIVGVRFFGLARPAGPVPRAARLARRRAAFARSRPRAGLRGGRAARARPARGHPARRPALAVRRRRRLAPEPVSARPRTAARRLIAGTASVVVAALFLPAAGLVLAVGLLVGGIAVPVAASSVSRRSAARYAQARGALSAELVETLAGSAGARGVRPRAGPHRNDAAEPIRGSFASPAGPRWPTASATACACS